MKKTEKYGHLPFDTNVPLHEENGYAKERGRGFSVNALGDKDPSYFEGFLADLIIGGPAQQNIYVDVKKV